jgi:hypothetical protein
VPGPLVMSQVYSTSSCLRKSTLFRAMAELSVLQNKAPPAQNPASNKM